MIKLKTLAVWAVLCAASIDAYAQDPVLMRINGVNVPRSEFEYSYNKNNDEGVVDKKTVREYVDLFVNYKLKVAAALDARLDTLASFREEYAVYRDMQVRPTLVTDADVVAQARQMYDRTKEAIGSKGLVLPAHIFLKLSTHASASEQERIRQRADSIYQALRAGADYAELAKRLSQDQPTAGQGGVFPVWVMPNQTFQEIEDIIYALPKGEISRPVLSPAGFHIMKVIDRKQLEPFDSLKNMLVEQIEQRGLREQIADNVLRQTVSQAGGALTEEQVMARRADSLAAADPEMKYLLKEYHDGLLMYEMSNRMVWEKAAQDEAGQQAWFVTHKKDYAWNVPRYKGIAYHVKTKADVKAVKRCLKGLPFSQWAEVLRTTFNPDSVIRIRVEKGLFKPGDNALIDTKVFKRPATYESLPDYPIDAVYGKKLKKGPEDYTDVRDQVITDYQEALEKEWVASLRRRYPVEINEEVLKTINQHP